MRKDCYYRANRAGAMLLLITVCRYLLPTLFLALLAAFGADIHADAFGMPQPLFLLVYLLMYVLMMGVPLGIIKARLLMPRTAVPSPLNLSPHRRLCIVLCGVALCLLANIVAALFSGRLFEAGLPEPTMPALGDGSALILLLDLVVFAGVPAVMEELLIRHMVLDTLRPLGSGVAVTVSALLFGLMHGNLTQTPYALLMGFVLGFIYIYSDDLWLTVAVHAVANALSVIAAYFLQFHAAAQATFWELVILIVALMLGGVSGVWLWQHRLERKVSPPSLPLIVRLRILFRAPLLWAAIAITLLVMALSIIL